MVNSRRPCFTLRRMKKVRSSKKGTKSVFCVLINVFNIVLKIQQCLLLYGLSSLTYVPILVIDDRMNN